MDPQRSGAGPAAWDDLADLAVEAATAAGRLLVQSLASGPGRVESKSTATDLVSDVDRASEALIVDWIRARRPADGILGEEGAEAPSSSGVRWVIDPLDGTVNYLYGIPVFAVSVAAEVGGTPVAGVVHDPSRGETFRAVRDGGATLDGRPLAVNRPDELRLSLVGTGFAYDAGVRRQQAELLPVLLTEVRDVRRAGSAALDLCSVAAGRLDAYFEAGTHHWDRAAGGLIAAEAGAVYGDLEGDVATDAMTFAAAPAVAAPLRDLLRRLGADRVLP